ncbi:MAG: hypothetical protein KIS75_17350, partial [Chromatiales bacterium]|nr:hypothetical protein [Chromatiales bacterium]
MSVPVHALGLGELSSKSGLNQNFSGDITLLSVQAEELDTVRVKLADTDAFARAGVDRPFYLSLLKFEPALTAKGATVIRVTSEFPIREPFLNFLVEVNWPNGRLLREYTVLLDPPTTTKRRPPQVTPAPQTRRTTPVPAAAAPARPAAPTAKTAVTAQSEMAAGGSEYGPVKANDTAWSIAKQVRPRGVSMEQMMIALLNANPNAFVDGNINRLRKGQILRVPNAAEIQQLSRQEARQAYRQQQDAWLAQRNEKLQSAAEQAAADTASTTSGATEADAQDQLRIATARPEGVGEAGAGDDNATATTSSDLSSRLIAARENAETSRQEAETLRSQVDDLQERLQNMQKLLTLKDDQLAQLQDRVVSEEAEVPAAAAPAEAEVPEVVLANQVDPAAADAKAEVAQAVDQAVAELTGAAKAPVVGYRIQDIPPQIDPDRIVLGGGAQAPGIQDIPPQIDPDRIVMGGSVEVPGSATMAPDSEPVPLVDATPGAIAETAVEAVQVLPE